MSSKWLFVFALIISLKGCTTTSKFNVSYEDLQQCECQEYITQGSLLTYVGEKFFKLESLQNYHKFNDDIVNINTFVLAKEMASILLTTNESHKLTDPAYEIAIGHNGEYFAVIRNRILGPILAKMVLSSDVLSPVNPLPLNIRLSKHGEIIAKINGLNAVVINATVSNPLPIKYISFSAFTLSKAKWFFNCKTDIYSSSDFEHTTILGHIDSSPITHMKNTNDENGQREIRNTSSSANASRTLSSHTHAKKLQSMAVDNIVVSEAPTSTIGLNNKSIIAAITICLRLYALHYVFTD